MTTTNVNDIFYGENTDGLIIKEGWKPSLGVYPPGVPGFVYIAEDDGEVNQIDYKKFDSIVYQDVGNGDEWIPFVLNSANAGEGVIKLNQWTPQELIEEKISFWKNPSSEIIGISNETNKIQIFLSDQEFVSGSEFYPAAISQLNSSFQPEAILKGYYFNLDFLQNAGSGNKEIVFTVGFVNNLTNQNTTIIDKGIAAVIKYSPLLNKFVLESFILVKENEFTTLSNPQISFDKNLVCFLGLNDSGQLAFYNENFTSSPIAQQNYSSFINISDYEKFGVGFISSSENEGNGENVSLTIVEEPSTPFSFNGINVIQNKVLIGGKLDPNFYPNEREGKIFEISGLTKVLSSEIGPIENKMSVMFGENGDLLDFAADRAIIDFSSELSSEIPIIAGDKIPVSWFNAWLNNPYPLYSKNVNFEYDLQNNLTQVKIKQNDIEFKSLNESQIKSFIPLKKAENLGKIYFSLDASSFTSIVDNVDFNSFLISGSLITNDFFNDIINETIDFINIEIKRRGSNFDAFIKIKPNFYNNEGDEKIIYVHDPILSGVDYFATNQSTAVLLTQILNKVTFCIDTETGLLKVYVAGSQKNLFLVNKTSNEVEQANLTEIQIGDLVFNKSWILSLNAETPNQLTNLDFKAFSNDIAPENDGYSKYFPTENSVNNLNFYEAKNVSDLKAGLFSRLLNPLTIDGKYYNKDSILAICEQGKEVIDVTGGNSTNDQENKSNIEIINSGVNVAEYGKTYIPNSGILNGGTLAELLLPEDFIVGSEESLPISILGNDGITLRINSGNLSIRLKDSTSVSFYQLRNNENVTLIPSPYNNTKWQLYSSYDFPTTIDAFNINVENLNADLFSTSSEMSVDTTSNVNSDKAGINIKSKIDSESELKLLTETNFGIGLKTDSNESGIYQLSSDAAASFSNAYIKFNPNSSVELYNNAAKKLETTNDGAKVTGLLSTDNEININDTLGLGSKLILNSLPDRPSEIILSDSLNFAANFVSSRNLLEGRSKVRLNQINPSTGLFEKSMINFNEDSSTELFFNGLKRAETTDTGFKIFGNLEFDGGNSSQISWVEYETENNDLFQELQNNQKVIGISNGTGILTFSLPSTPIQGQEIQIIAGTDRIQINPNGQKVFDLGNSLNENDSTFLLNGFVKLVYVDGANGAIIDGWYANYSGSSSGSSSELQTKEVINVSSYTVIPDDLGKIIKLTNSTDIEVLIPDNLGTNFNFTLEQGNDGKLNWSNSIATINNVDDHVRTKGIYSQASFISFDGLFYTVSGSTEDEFILPSFVRIGELNFSGTDFYGFFSSNNNPANTGQVGDIYLPDLLSSTSIPIGSLTAQLNNNIATYELRPEDSFSFPNLGNILLRINSTIEITLTWQEDLINGNYFSFQSSDPLNQLLYLFFANNVNEAYSLNIEIIAPDIPAPTVTSVLIRNENPTLPTGDSKLGGVRTITIFDENDIILDPPGPEYGNIFTTPETDDDNGRILKLTLERNTQNNTSIITLGVRVNSGDDRTFEIIIFGETLIFDSPTEFDLNGFSYYEYESAFSGTIGDNLFNSFVNSASQGFIPFSVSNEFGGGPS